MGYSQERSDRAIICNSYNTTCNLTMLIGTDRQKVMLKDQFHD